MEQIKPSELVLNNDNSVYHLKLHPHQLAENVILVGDPNRVQLVSSFFDKIEFKVQNREIVTHTGFYNSKRVTALSTGMGTDNIDIVINELDALVNIDLEKREIKNSFSSLNLVRLGTSGALQADIPVHSNIISEFALGLDGLMNYYHCKYNDMENDLRNAFIKETQYPPTLAQPYFVEASRSLSNKLGGGFIKGITATACGFYGPQGRTLRIPLQQPQINEQLNEFKFGTHRITNFEMESSALYGLSKALGHNACTICLVIANRFTNEFSKDYHPNMKELILKTLDRLTN